MEKSICQNCKKEFYYYTSRSSGKFCNKSCHFEFIRIKPKNCEICKKSYLPERQRKNRISRYCSLECMWKAKKRGKFIFCKSCRKKIWRKNYKLNLQNNFYCSRKCYAIHKAKVTKGKNNANWKDGISSNKYSARKGSSLQRKGRYYERKIRKILEKEGYYTIRSAASKGIWDIIAIKEDNIRLIQSKAGLSHMKPEERKKIELFKQPQNTTKEIWHFFGHNKLKKEIIQ